MSRSSKIGDPLKKAKSCIKLGHYTVTYHAQVRQLERLVPLPDVLFSIENGHHEKSKDRYDDFYDSWNYSIRGKTTDRRDLRIVITFDEEDELLIITVVVLKGEK